jgi:two-component system response regulator HydG
MSPREPTGETETRRHGTSVVPPPVTLDAVVVEGADAGKLAALDASGGKVLIGTSALCDLRLGDPTVSRRHASIERTDLGVLLTDLGSTNGTYLGDARIVAAYLAEGARIRIGSATLEVRASDAPAVKARRTASLGRMASSSPRMINVLTLCQRLAPSDMPVVLEGETGTGKEVLAESIHEASGRAAQPFVVLDCRTTPGELAEGYLFGELRADGTIRPGIFELAGEGTLLVDEPGDLSLEMQAKLLRALDKGVVQRVGDPTPIRVSARILVATSNDFDRLVDEGKLREDLYHRLAGARIEVPPLRRRREDIGALAGEIWTDLGGKGFLPDEFLQRFEGYDWPGNVRELERALRRFLVLGDSVSLLVTRTHRHKARPVDADDEGGADHADLLARVLAANLGYSEARERMLDEFERAYLEKALADSGGNVAAAAARSGIARRHFQRLRARQR